MKRKLSIVLAVACIWLPVVPESAPRAESGSEPYRLPLADCLRLALQNNLDLVAARVDPEISAARVQIQQGSFDPTFVAGASTDETSQRPVDPTQPADRANLDLNASVQQNLNFGGDYRATFFYNENDAPGFNSLINPFKTTGISLQYNMPLLKNRGRETTQEQLLLARGNLEVSNVELKRQAELTLEQVEGAYWDLLAGQEALEVARQSLRRAQDLLELNRKKVEVGTLAPIEITQADAGVASQEEGVILAETDAANAADQLRKLMAIPEGDSMWERPIVPTNRPIFDPLQIDLEQSLAAALANRPEMATARQQLRNLDLSERVANRQKRHQLDLEVQYRPVGDNDESFLDPLGPDGTPNTGDELIVVQGGLSDSLGEIFKVDNYFWRVGVNYTVPFGNHAAKANHRIAELSRDKGQIDLQRQEQTIRVEVRAAAREMESGVKRVEAARKNVELQQKKLEAEQKKFENGMSTSFEVLTFQNDLADAQLALVRAGLDYTKAQARLERVKGTLLEARGLSLEP